MGANKQRGIKNPKGNDIPDDQDAWVSSGAENGDRQPQEATKDDHQPPEVKKPLKRITFTVPEDLHRSVHIYARQNDITVTDLLTQYLKELIAQE